jgi:multiple sugar transport system ATP-binding protein
MVYVTHDQVEAMTMGQRIAVMSDGLLRQVGTPQDLYDSPRNKFVAGFIGSPSMNFIDIPVGTGDLSVGGFTFPIPDRYRESIKGAGTTVVAGFRPEHLELGELGSVVGTVQGKADVVEYLGNEELLHVSVGEREVVAIVDSAHNVRPGDIVNLKLPVDKLHLFNLETGDSIAKAAAA